MLKAKRSAPQKVVPPDVELLMWPGHLLRRCHQRSLEIFNDIVGQHDVTRQQVAVLMVLDRMPRATQQALAEASGFDRNTLADITDRLVRKGLVRRVRSVRDNRAYEVTMTDKGAAVLREMMPGLMEVQERILAPLPQDRREIFIQCLRIIIGLEAPPGGTAGAWRAGRR